MIDGTRYTTTLSTAAVARILEIEAQAALTGARRRPVGVEVT